MAPFASERRLVLFWVANARNITRVFETFAMERSVSIVSISLSDHVVCTGTSGEVLVHVNLQATACFFSTLHL